MLDSHDSHADSTNSSSHVTNALPSDPVQNDNQNDGLVLESATTSQNTQPLEANKFLCNSGIPLEPSAMISNISAAVH